MMAWISFSVVQTQTHKWVDASVGASLDDILNAEFF